MTKCAILIAVEEFLETGIAEVKHAQRDAEAFSNALVSYGFAKADQLILVNNQATKSVVESKVRKAIRRLRKDDTLYFYYGGRAFSQGSRNFIACHDTQDSDWDITSVELAPILEELQASKCASMVLFLDFSPVSATPDDADVYDHFNERELEAFVDATPRCVCFAACRADESSHASEHLQHRIWMYHIIEAFTGDAPLAVRKGVLTADSLQSYVHEEVLRTLRKEHPTPQVQTPWMYRASTADEPLVDMRELLAEKRAVANSDESLVTELKFVIERIEEVRGLAGWKPSYRIPQNFSDANQSFVAGVAKHELKEDLDRVYQGLKEAFEFSRRDLESAEPEDGAATIITPHFNYSVTVSLNPDNTREVIWTRMIDAIKDAAQIASPAFAEVFDGVFDTLNFSFPTRLNIADFIDAVEAAKIADLKLSYDREATYCEFQIRGGAGTVTVKPSSLSIVHSGPRTTQQLIDSFDAIRQLVNKHHVPLLSFAAPRRRQAH